MKIDNKYKGKIAFAHNQLILLEEKPRVNKYKNKKININGLIFDSQKEAIRYAELKVLEKKGEISNLQRQVKFELIPTIRENDFVDKKGKIKKGKVIERNCCYVADFTYKKNDELIVEDTKGLKTKEYIIKRKLMLYLLNIKIIEI